MLALVGRVTVRFKVTNHLDVRLHELGLRKVKPRALQVEALVDTGATRLYLKPSVIRRLGLQPTGKVRSRTTNGDCVRQKFDVVCLELMGRKEVFEVVEVPENVPNLLGQLPLEALDLVVDSKGQRLIGNPAHGGEQATEEY